MSWIAFSDGQHHAPRGPISRSATSVRGVSTYREAGRHPVIIKVASQIDSVTAIAWDLNLIPGTQATRSVGSARDAELERGVVISVTAFSLARDAL